MELKQRKLINNTLPKFDNGLDQFQWNQNSYNQLYSTDQYPTIYQQALTDQQINQMVMKPVSNPVIQQTQPVVEEKGVIDYGGGGSTRGYKLYQDGVNEESPSGSKAAAVVGGVTSLIQGYLGQQSTVKSAEEIMANAGTQNRSIGGVGYVRQNYANDSEVLSNLDKSGLSNTLSSAATGASAGAAFGLPGALVGFGVGAIGGLFGWGKSKSAQRKRLNNARQLTSRINTGNQAGAMTTALQQDYYSQYGNTNGGILYANKGKDIGII